MLVSAKKNMFHCGGLLGAHFGILDLLKHGLEHVVAHCSHRVVLDGLLFGKRVAVLGRLFETSERLVVFAFECDMKIKLLE